MRFEGTADYEHTIYNDEGTFEEFKEIVNFLLSLDGVVFKVDMPNESITLYDISYDNYILINNKCLSLS